MFAHGNHSMMGSEEDPKDGGKVATAVFGAVGVYGVRQYYRDVYNAVNHGIGEANVSTMQAFLLFCGSQALLHRRQSSQGEIALR